MFLRSLEKETKAIIDNSKALTPLSVEESLERSKGLDFEGIYRRELARRTKHEAEQRRNRGGNGRRAHVPIKAPGRHSIEPEGHTANPIK